MSDYVIMLLNPNQYLHAVTDPTAVIVGRREAGGTTTASFLHVFNVDDLGERVVLIFSFEVSAKLFIFHYECVYMSNMRRILIAHHVMYQQKCS